MPRRPSLPYRPARRITRRAGAGSLVLGVVVLALAWLVPAAGAATGTATLRASHIGATNPGFGASGECPASPDPDATWGWHFVLPGNDTTFVSITVQFQTAGTVTEFVSFPTGKHAYVYTAGPDVLLGATAVVDGPETVFNLSHVCTGEETAPVTTTTTGETTTTTTESTLVEGPTTTEAGGGGPSTTTPGMTTAPGRSTTTITTGGNGAVATSAARPTTAEVLGVTQTRPGTRLPATGSASGPLLVLAGGLILAGLVLLERARRAG